VHLREVHKIHGADKSRVYYLWDDCGMGVNKKSLSRHVEETHLHIIIGHECDTCDKMFSQRGALSKHKRVSSCL
jgi:hypothetical protein